MGSPVFGYMATGGSTVKTPAVGSPPYQVSLEDRLRWAQIADVMVQANHYAVSIENENPSNPPPPPPIPIIFNPVIALFGARGSTVG